MEKKKNILVVDDDRQLSYLLVDTLQTIGYNARGADSAKAALDIIDSEPIDLIISDIGMPRMDGFQLAARIRETHPHIRILLITGVATRESEEKALKENLCDGYIAKPFRIDRIEAMIERQLSSDTPATDPGPGRVLVVDDDENFLDAMVETVRNLGYRVEGVADSDAALSALRREGAEMVFADVSMPRMNGFDLLRVLKRNYPHMPVVMMTGHNLSEPAAETIRTTADAYLTKPFREERVKRVLDTIGRPALDA